MIVTEENRDLGYSSLDSDDHIGSDTEYEYDPASTKSDEDTSQDYAIDDITESLKDVYIERAPIRNKGIIHNRNSNNVSITRPQTSNFHAGGGIINTSNRFNNIFVPNYPTTHTNNFGQHLNINQEPEVLLGDTVNEDEISQDNLGSNTFYIQTINESVNQLLPELPGDFVLSIFQDLNQNKDELNINENCVEDICGSEDICAFSNIAASNSDWSSHRTYTESFSTTSTVSSAEYSPLSIASTSDIPQSSESYYSSDDAHSCQSAPDLYKYFTPTLNEYDLFDDHLLIPKTVNDAEERCTAKELVQKCIKQYPKERIRKLWVQANNKTPAELMIDIRALVESNIDDELDIQLYAIVQVFLMNASAKQCKEVFKRKPTVSDLLERKAQRLLRRYIDEIVQKHCMDEN